MNIYLFSLSLCIIFIIFKILINKYVEKNKPIKPIFKNSILIFIISIVTNYIYINFIKDNMESSVVTVFLQINLNFNCTFWNIIHINYIIFNII